MLEPVQKLISKECLHVIFCNKFEVRRLLSKKKKRSADSAPGVETEIAEWIEPSPRIWMTSSARCLRGMTVTPANHQAAGVAPLCLLTCLDVFLYVCLNLTPDFWHLLFSALELSLVFRAFPHLGLAQNLWRKGSLLPKQFLRGIFGALERPSAEY